MKLDYRLNLEQAQKLVITPELKLAITLLQYSTLELVDYIQEELLNNPVLEVQDSAEKDGGGEPAEEAAREPGASEDFPWEEYFRDNDIGPVGDYPSPREGDDLLSVENCAGRAVSMVEDLLSQLRLCGLSPRRFSMAAFLVGNLDGNGYLRGEIEELAQSLGTTEEELTSVLEIVQGLEPAGIACRNLQECLLLQVKRLENPPPLAVEIIKNFLPAAADGRYRHIAARLNCSPEAVSEAVEFIRTLNPKPGSAYGGGDAPHYIVPDLLVEKVGSDYVVIVNDALTPQLTINPFYHRLMQNGGKDDKLSAFVKRKLAKAYWLMRSIEQRRLTLYKVACQIVDIQKPFLEYGIKHLRPLTLREVARQVGVHESTVSRATNNKYIQTPRGLFPMKFFFSSSLVGEGGEDFSSLSIKTALRELVEKEDRQRPLSDQQLTELLKEQGVVISRRTVAKYREELGIPASYKRRRF